MDADLRSFEHCPVDRVPQDLLQLCSSRGVHLDRASVNLFHGFDQHALQPAFSDRRQALASTAATVIEPAVTGIAYIARTTSSALNQPLQQIVMFLVARRERDILMDLQLNAFPASPWEEPQS
jgi:hypothetical protein